MERLLEVPRGGIAMFSLGFFFFGGQEETPGFRMRNL